MGCDLEIGLGDREDGLGEDHARNDPYNYNYDPAK